jgi:hypothetical protein
MTHSVVTIPTARKMDSVESFIQDWGMAQLEAESEENEARGIKYFHESSCKTRRCGGHFSIQQVNKSIQYTAALCGAKQRGKNKKESSRSNQSSVIEAKDIYLLDFLYIDRMTTIR